LVFAAAFLLAMALAMVAAVAATVAKSQALTFVAIALGVLVVVVGFMLAISFLLRYAVTVPALVLENLSARQALKRSAFLTRGYRGQIFLIGILMYLLTLVVGALFQGPFLASGLLLGFKFG